MIVQAVIFDADGTLIDSEIPGMDVMYEQACEAGLALTRDEAHDYFRGRRMSEIVAWIASQLPEVPVDFESNFTARVRKLQAERFRESLAPMPGACELLGQLTVPFCVATNGPPEKVELTLELSGLRHYFGEHVYSAYRVGYFKPDPRLFLHVAEKLKVLPEHCAVVEDSLPGIYAGLGAGMLVFSLHSAEDLPDDVVGRVISIETLSDLTKWLDGIVGVQ